VAVTLLIRPAEKTVSIQVQLKHNRVSIRSPRVTIIKPVKAIINVSRNDATKKRTAAIRDSLIRRVTLVKIILVKIILVKIILVKIILVRRAALQTAVGFYNA